MSERQAKTPTLRALLPSRLVPEDMLSEWQGPNLPNTKNYAPPPDSMRGRMGDVLMQGIAALGGFTGLPMGGEGSKAALLGELLAAGMPLVGGIKALPGAKVLAGPAWEKALRFYAEAGGLAERHVPRMANALRRAGIKVPARSVAEKVAAHKIVNEALDLAHTPAGPVEGPFATPQGIKAFHGSPHDFEKFSLDKIGTGEGAQAYGHGLYFAENEGVARAYRDTLSGPSVFYEGGPKSEDAIKRLGQLGVPRDTADVWTTLAYEGGMTPKDNPTKFLRSMMDDEQDMLPQLNTEEVRNILREYVTKPTPRMYEVSINADPEDFLDWDAPLSQQSEKVRQTVGGLLPAGRSADDFQAGEYLYKHLTRHDPLTGKMTPQAELSSKLGEAGIPGIKYLDGNSRPNQATANDVYQSMGKWHIRNGPSQSFNTENDALVAADALMTQPNPTRNYVVFDDKLISIVKKYGIAGALSAGAINELEARQLQAQGYQ